MMKSLSQSRTAEKERSIDIKEGSCRILKDATAGAAADATVALPVAEDSPEEVRLTAPDWMADITVWRTDTASMVGVR